MARTFGPHGLRVLKGYETGGFHDAKGRLRLLPHGTPALDAYRDDVGVWTIGWGHTDHVRPGQTITPAQAEILLAADIAWAVACVDNAIGNTPTTQDQLDAMVLLTFNIGATHFLSSTVLRRHCAKNYAGAADAFAAWNKGTVGGKLVELAGLTERRATEAAIYRGAIS